MIPWLLAALMMLSPGLVLAHAGGHADVGPAHVLSSPWHLPGLLMVAVALLALGLRALRDRTRNHAPQQANRHDPR